MIGFHARQYLIGAMITILAMGLYAVCPRGKEGLFHDISIAGMAFVFGKFTNNFGGGRRQGPRDTHRSVHELHSRNDNVGTVPQAQHKWARRKTDVVGMPVLPPATGDRSDEKGEE